MEPASSMGSGALGPSPPKATSALYFVPLGKYMMLFMCVLKHYAGEI